MADTKPTPPATPDQGLPPEGTTKPVDPNAPPTTDQSLPEGERPTDPNYGRPGGGGRPGQDLPSGEHPTDPRYGRPAGGEGRPNQDLPSYGSGPGQIKPEDGDYVIENVEDGPRGFHANNVEIMLDVGERASVTLTADELTRVADYGFKVTKAGEEAKPKGK